MLTNLCKVGGLYSSCSAFHLTMHCYICSLLNDALHLNEHEAARWLRADELRSVNWLPADEQLLPLIERELLTTSED